MTSGMSFHAGDQQMDGFDQWAFMTTHSWDEPSAGVWRLEVRNGQSACK